MGSTFSSGQSRGGNGGSITLQPGSGGTGTASSGIPGNVILAPRGREDRHRYDQPDIYTRRGGWWYNTRRRMDNRSSRRFKVNIHLLEGALEKVEQLQGVSYRRKSDGKNEIGIVAEDADLVVPEVVSRDPETNEVEGLDYSRLVALLIEAIKSQQVEIRQMRERIGQLSTIRIPESARQGNERVRRQ